MANEVTKPERKVLHGEIIPPKMIIGVDVGKTPSISVIVKVKDGKIVGVKRG